MANSAPTHARFPAVTLIRAAISIGIIGAVLGLIFASTYRDNHAIRKLSRAIHNGFQTMGAFAADESGSGGAYASPVSYLDNNASRVENQNLNHNPAATGSATDMLAIKQQ